MIYKKKKTYTSTKCNNSSVIYMFTHNSYSHTKTFFNVDVNEQIDMYAKKFEIA